MKPGHARELCWAVTDARRENEHDGLPVVEALHHRIERNPEEFLAVLVD